MKSLIITVAGTATRFNKDTSTDTLKCLYYVGEPTNCLLAQMLEKTTDIDEIIIVGGYLFDQLDEFIKVNLSKYLPKIKLVYNPEFQTFGSGFSLIKGIEALSPQCTEVIFAEGDLFFDAIEFRKIIETRNNIITINHELITAKKAVVVYVKLSGEIQYLYDTSHTYLEIPEPFLAVYNSAQIWKFTNPTRLRAVVNSLSQKQIEGTNLEIIQGYFGSLAPEDYETIALSTWFNCNTVDDYNNVYSIITK